MIYAKVSNLIQAQENVNYVIDKEIFKNFRPQKAKFAKFDLVQRRSFTKCFLQILANVRNKIQVLMLFKLQSEMKLFKAIDMSF